MQLWTSKHTNTYLYICLDPYTHRDTHRHIHTHTHTHTHRSRHKLMQTLRGECNDSLSQRRGKERDYDVSTLLIIWQEEEDTCVWETWKRKRRAKTERGQQKIDRHQQTYALSDTFTCRMCTCKDRLLDTDTYTHRETRSIIKSNNNITLKNKIRPSDTCTMPLPEGQSICMCICMYASSC